MKKLIETTFPTAETHAEQLALAVAEQLKQTLITKGQAVLAVSGGRSPIAFFHALSQQSLAWDKVVITLVDERIVATDHDDSNTALVRKNLLINHAKTAKFHGLLADDTDYDNVGAETAEKLAQIANQAFIQPDTVILGMGEDAHTASLFPHVADLSATDNVIAVLPTTAPYARLSLSLNAILQAQCVYLAIGGAGKMAVYQQAKAEKNIAQPISCVLHQDNTPVEVFYYG